jgi:hypothetical protein
LQMKKWRHREVKKHAQSHTALKQPYEESESLTPMLLQGPVFHPLQFNPGSCAHQLRE